jgi:hypothetical protein
MTFNSNKEENMTIYSYTDVLKSPLLPFQNNKIEEVKLELTPSCQHAFKMSNEPVSTKGKKKETYQKEILK